MKAAASTRPVTIADLTASGKLIWLYCNDCCHECEIPPATLPLPQSRPVPEVGKRMVCTECGGRRVETKPELYPSEH